MSMYTKDNAELYTHKEDGGIYYYHGLAHGTGDQRGELLHIYSDYFTDMTYYRNHTWSTRMERVSAPGLRLSRFLHPRLWITTLIGLMIIIITQVVFGTEFNAITPQEIVGTAVAGVLALGLPSFILHQLYKWKYRKPVKQKSEAA